jgi:hypothetical protein
MATLFDKLSQPQTQLPVNNQSRIETLLAAKKGKMGQSAPAASNIVEQATQDQNKAQAKQAAVSTAIEGAGQQAQRTGLENQIQQAGAAQQQSFDLNRQGITADSSRNQAGLAAQEQSQNVELDAAKQRKLRGINAQAESQLRALAAQGRMEVDDLFADFARSNQELAFRKDAAQLEQFGTLLALQDRKYVDELNRIGEKRKLYDQSNWAKEKSRIVYGDNLDALMSDLQFKRGEDITNRDFQKQLASLDITTALEMARAAMRDNAQREMATAGISAISTAAGTDWGKFKDPTPTPVAVTNVTPGAESGGSNFATGMA